MPCKVTDWWRRPTSARPTIWWALSRYAIYTLSVQLNPLPGSETFAWIISWILPVIIGLLVFTFLLFPTGRLPGRRWRWFAWLTVTFVVAGVTSAAFSLGANAGVVPIRNPLGIEGASYVYDIVMDVSIFLFIAAVFSQFVRLRRATGVERQQIKWLAYGAPWCSAPRSSWPVWSASGA
jgi:hypothetical protein